MRYRRIEKPQSYANHNGIGSISAATSSHSGISISILPVKGGSGRGERSYYCAKGFTFIELIVVLVIIATVSAVLLTRIQPNRSDLIAWHEKIKAHLRYAQNRSMNSRYYWGIKIEAQFTDTPRQYFLFKIAANESQTIAQSDALRLPGEEDAARLVALPDRLTLTPAEEAIITFDHWGRPFIGFAYMTADLPFNLNQAADQEQILITADTGFIP